MQETCICETLLKMNEPSATRITEQPLDQRPLGIRDPQALNIPSPMGKTNQSIEGSQCLDA